MVKPKPALPRSDIEAMVDFSRGGVLSPQEIKSLSRMGYYAGGQLTEAGARFAETVRAAETKVAADRERARGKWRGYVE